MEEQGQLDVIRSGRWERALFLTYALSLSFFESEVWRALTKAGAENPETWIVVDQDGYRQSLMERQSRHVGIHYRLVPVALDSGFFHPKCIYLQGVDGDLLLVGSGNLTFGGFGRNLEVLEVLDPRRCPETFLAFAELLENLGARANLHMPPEKSWIDIFSQHALDAASSNDGVIDPFRRTLIHNATRPAADRIVELSREIGAIRELVALSPYHSPDGQALAKLANQCRAGMLSVGLPTRKDSKSSFPFAKVSNWDTKVVAVCPEVDEPERPLHAKWFEFVGDKGRLTITGSINATEQALYRLGNIEVAVARLEPETERRVLWKSVPIPTDFDAPTMKGSDQGIRILFARLDSDGRLRGSVIPARGAEGPWRGFLSFGNEVGPVFDVSIDAQGTFQIPAGSIMASSQLQLSRGDETARGWVHVEDLIRLGRSGADVGAIIRILSHQALDDDYFALLHALVQHGPKYLPAFQAKVTDRGGPGPFDAPEESFRPGDLAPDSGTPGLPGFKGQSGASQGALDRLLGRFRHMLLSPGAKQGTGAEPDEDDGEGRSPSRRVTEPEGADRFAGFNKEMQRLVNTAEVDADRRRLLVMWVEVSFFFLQLRFGDQVERGVDFARDWYSVATSKAKRLPEIEGPLDQHVITLACICSELAFKGRDLLRLQLQDRINEIGEALERYWGGPVTPEEAERLMLGADQTRYWTCLFGEELPNPREALRKLQNYPTKVAQLRRLLSQIEAKEAVDLKTAVLDSPPGRALRQAIERGRPRLRPAGPRLALCPTCFLHCEARARELQVYRITHCSVCNLFLVRTEP